MHLEYGPLSEEYVLKFVDKAKAMNLDEIQILDHSHRFVEFEKMYEPLKKYDVQKIWLENKQMKFKDSVAEFVELMQNIKSKDLGIKIKYGLEICYTPSAEQLIKDVVNNFHFDFLFIKAKKE